MNKQQRDPFVAVAKFQVSSILFEGFRREDRPVTSAIIVKMNAIYGQQGDESNENWKFTKATPSGSFEMRIENEALFGSFYVGQQIYLPLIDADMVDLGDVSQALYGLRVKQELARECQEA